MNPELRALYQEMILDHGKRPRHFGTPKHYTHRMDAYNPLCGDRLTLYATIADGKVKGLHFEGSGCAISMASASMMCEEVEGKACDAADELYHQFQGLVTGRAEATDMSRLNMLAGVKSFPSRVKCATLAWHALDHVLTGKSEEMVTTE